MVRAAIIDVFMVQRTTFAVGVWHVHMVVFGANMISIQMKGHLLRSFWMFIQANCRVDAMVERQ
jgi:hypothetical protein